MHLNTIEFKIHNKKAYSVIFAQVGSVNRTCHSPLRVLCSSIISPFNIHTLTKLLEGRLGPDTEPSDMTSRGELEKVQGVNRDGVYSGDVTESLGETLKTTSHIN